jgi:hypothetical protein
MPPRRRRGDVCGPSRGGIEGRWTKPQPATLSRCELPGSLPWGFYPPLPRPATPFPAPPALSTVLTHRSPTSLLPPRLDQLDRLADSPTFTTPDDALHARTTESPDQRCQQSPPSLFTLWPSSSGAIVSLPASPVAATTPGTFPLPQRLPPATPAPRARLFRPRRCRQRQRLQTRHQQFH